MLDSEEGEGSLDKLRELFVRVRAQLDSVAGNPEGEP